MGSHRMSRRGPRVFFARSCSSTRRGVCCSPGRPPSLAASYIDAIGRVPIAAGRIMRHGRSPREMVFVEDVERSDLWATYAPIALAHGLRACWSTPIFDDTGALLGTLALYYRERRTPTTAEIDFIQCASSLASFVIQRHRDTERPGPAKRDSRQPLGTT